MLILFALILRAVSFEFRGHIDNPTWCRLWDVCLFVGSLAPALLLGVAFANIFRGVPFDANGVLQGNLFTLLNPYGLVGGVLFVSLFVVHGLLWLAIKAEGALQDRASRAVIRAWTVLLVVAVIFLVHTWFATPLYRNYVSFPALFLIPLLAVAALLTMRLFMARAQWWKAWFASCFTILFATLLFFTLK